MSVATNRRRATMTFSDTSLVADSFPKPKIGLEDLPQELRDQIYDYVIDGCYWVHHFPRYYHGNFPALSEVSSYALLQTSKRVRNDAMEVCFSKVEFCWVLKAEYCEWYHENCWKISSSVNMLPNQLRADRLMNILLVFDIGEYTTLFVSERLGCHLRSPQNFWRCGNLAKKDADRVR